MATVHTYHILSEEDKRTILAREQHIDETLLDVDAVMTVAILMDFRNQPQMAALWELCHTDKQGLLQVLKILERSRIPERMRGRSLS
jgi:hypothetical protein